MSKQEIKERLQKALREKALSKGLCPECGERLIKKMRMTNKRVVYVKNYVVNYPRKPVQVRNYEEKQTCINCDYKSTRRWEDCFDL